MKDEDLVKLVETIGYREGLPVVTDPGILSPKKFIDEVLQVRVPNPFMPDTPSVLPAIPLRNCPFVSARPSRHTWQAASWM